MNIGLEVGMGEGSEINRLGATAKWAFINRRDRAAYPFGEDLKPAYAELLRAMSSADSSYMAYLKSRLGDSSGSFRIYYDQYVTSLKKFTVTQDPQDLDPVFYRKFGKGIETRARAIHAAGDSIAREIDNRLLATVEMNVGYRTGESGYYGLNLEAYQGAGNRSEFKVRTGLRITDSASTWSRFRWDLPLEINFNFVLTKTSASSIELTALVAGKFSGAAGSSVTDGTWAQTYGLGLSLPIAKRFFLPLLIRNDSFSAWHGTASMELSLNIEPNSF